MGTFVAVVVALAALGISVGVARRNRAIERALEQERRENKELKSTLVEVLDEEGNIRGQLALPGEVTTKGVSKKLAIAEQSVSTLQLELKETTQQLHKEVTQATDDLRRAKGELEAALSREEALQQTMAEVVDKDGKVLAQLRIPGEEVNPTTTPCGDMCKLAYQRQKHDHYGHVVGFYWACKANQDRRCDESRSKFLNAQNECVLFVRDDDC